jgi:hypothetical protein
MLRLPQRRSWRRYDRERARIIRDTWNALADILQEEKLAQKLKTTYARVLQAQEPSMQSQTNSSADEQKEYSIDSTQQAVSAIKAQADMMDWKVVQPKKISKKQKQNAKHFVKLAKASKIL